MNHLLQPAAKRALWILPAWAMLGTGCGQSPEAKAARNEIGEAVDATKQYAEELAASARVEERLAALRADLARLRERMAEKANDTDWKAVADDIEAKLDAAGEELTELGKDSAETAEETWDKLRAKLEAANAELQETWKQVRD